MAEGIDFQMLLLTVTVFLILVVIFRKKTSAVFPPAPPGLPLIGNVHQLKKGKLHLQATELAKTYGGIFTLNFFGQKMAFLSDLETMKQAMVDQADVFSDNFQAKIGEYMFGKTPAIVFATGERWKDARRVALQALRRFGVGKRSLDEKINEEARYLLEIFEAQNGQPFDPRKSIRYCTASIVCNICFNERYDHDDPALETVVAFLEEFQSKVLGRGKLLGRFPWLWNSPLYKKEKKKFDDFNDFFRNRVKEHEKTFDSDDIRDVVDAYLQNYYTSQEEGKRGVALEPSHIWRAVMNLFSGGTEPIASAIQFAILLLTQYPAVQKKVQEEIDSIIGRHRQPSLNDRASMPYLTATLMEVLRFRPTGPFAPPKRVSRRTKLCGYDITPDHMIFANVWAVLHSSKYWDSPDEFLPERFLTDEGKLAGRPPAYIPFGIGRRTCVGDKLSETELFLHIVNLLQRFTLMIPEGDPKPSLDGSFSQFLVTPSFRLIALKR